MYRYLALALALCCLSTAYAQQFNVATYNFRLDTPSDTGNRWQQRSPHLINQIKYHRFDIFGTQEGFKHQLEDVHTGLEGFEYIGVGRDDGKEKGEYAAIFYNTVLFDLLQHGNFWLSEETSYPNKGWDAALPRICTWGKFKDKRTGFTFLLFNVHFDHVGVEARKNSTKLILEQAKAIGSELPMIITGDFNVDQHNESYALLHNSGIVQDAYELADEPYAPNGTFTGFDITRANDRRIDHIFVSDAFEVERFGILTDSYLGKLPSDHFPVVVEVSY